MSPELAKIAALIHRPPKVTAEALPPPPLPAIKIKELKGHKNFSAEEGKASGSDQREYSVQDSECH